MIKRNNILVILGMHRSGTSFLTHCMEVLGFELPYDRNGPAPDNLKGHFEPLSLVSLNNATLARHGGFWARVTPTHPHLSVTEMESAIEDSFDDAESIVIKDPRMSLLMQGWRPYLESLGSCSALIALRHPGEVASSLAIRDNMGSDLAYLSWITHTLSALDTTQGMSRGLILFPDWTRDISNTLHHMATITDTDIPADAAIEIEARFESCAVHGDQRLPPSDPDIGLLAHDLFEFLAVHARERTLPENTDLIPFHKRFHAVSTTARSIEAYLSDQVRALRSRIGEIIQDRISLEQQFDEIRNERNRIVSILEDRIAATEQQRDIATRQLSEKTQRLNTATQQLDKTKRSFHETSQRLDEATQDLDETTQDLIKVTQLLGDNTQRFKEITDTHDQQLRHITRLLDMERITVLKPIYRRLHRTGGRLLRRVLPRPVFEKIKRIVPYPGGIPACLVYSPPQATDSEIMRSATVSTAQSDKPDIFVMSIIDWDFRIQRPQHLATELARAGHRVFYMEMTTGGRTGSIRQVLPNAYVIRLPAQGMRDIVPYSGTVSTSGIHAWINHFYRFTDQVQTTSRAHVLIEHPYWWNFVRHLSSQFQLTFDCMDEISGFANAEQAILDLEKDMVEKADRVIVSSQYLHDKYAPKRVVTLVRNGTATSHFTSGGIPDHLPDFLDGRLRDGAIRVGYIGAIAEWFDTDLVEQIARQNPDFDIHLCGSVTAEAPVRLNNLPNVTMHGEIPYADVPAFLKAMDVMIIPFQLLPIINACDPVKFYEYSAAGKPTVATCLPELKRAGDLVITANEATGFAAGIRRSVVRSADPTHAGKLRRYATENDWSYRATDMLAEMERAPRLSVIILTHGPAELSLACLHSLYMHGGTYPNMEILLVDNGSEPAELDRLREAALAHPDVRLIENGKNLGFAQGNNVGIKAAQGEYILLLNNDTYVAPGALSAMLHHLETNPRIGIIGPLTNNTGNEARVEIAYADMKEMELAARTLITGYRGISTAIPVCAYFCAMFRKADLNRIGQLPTIYGRGMFEDDDHCASFRRAGLMTALAEDAFVHHHLSATFNQMPPAEKSALFEANKAIFKARWGEWTPHRHRTARPVPNLTYHG
ncbi:MAG: glycosyltransferase [Paracoccus sp. (in: a-proteobacteria)]